MTWRSPQYRHHHSLTLEKAIVGVLSGLTIYHFRCSDPECHWPFWCYKHEFWNTEPVKSS